MHSVTDRTSFRVIYLIILIMSLLTGFLSGVGFGLGLILTEFGVTKILELSFITVSKSLWTYPIKENWIIY